MYVGRVTRMGQTRKHTDFCRNFEMSSPEKHEGQWEKNIEEKFREISVQGLLYLAQDRDQCRAVGNSVMNLRFVV